MKRILMVFLIIGLFSTGSAHADWVDDWIQQKTVTGPSSFQGQQRGYLSGGSVSARWRNSSDYLMSIEKPYLRFGCGGIDAFMGSYSFLNSEYLVSKFQRIIQNAPALAFNIALDTLASQVNKQVNWLESQVDMLNSIQLDDCSMAKKAVTYVREPSKISEDLQRAEAVVKNSIESGGNDLYDKTKTDVTNSSGEQTVGDTAAGGPLASCPQEIKDVFLTPNTSVLRNIAGKLSYPTGYLDTMRGHIGDLRITDAGGIIRFSDTLPCPDNDGYTVENLIEGTTYARPEMGGSCVQISDTNRNVKTWVSNNLDSIVTKMKGKTILTASEQAFVGVLPALPAYQYLKYAVVSGDDNLIKDEISTNFAKFYSVEMMYDLYSRVIKAYKEADKILNQGSSKKGCNLEMIKDSLDKVKKLSESAAKEREKLEAKRSEIKKELIAVKAGLDQDYWKKGEHLYKKANPKIRMLRNRKS